MLLRRLSRSENATGCDRSLLTGSESIADASFEGGESHVSMKVRIAARTLQKVTRFVNNISHERNPG